jgi:hypothetical protein
MKVQRAAPERFIAKGIETEGLPSDLNEFSRIVRDRILSECPGMRAR